MIDNVAILVDDERITRRTELQQLYNTSVHCTQQLHDYSCRLKARRVNGLTYLGPYLLSRVHIETISLDATTCRNVYFLCCSVHAVT